ncbi:hypothetical protein BWQ96_01951 [Gracilariopsis chorda]|uniref:t-SNARE coiled-coil homology domain-containing protein n=1 Tax=Gracilariopsis chorda TaxID=448386 RepID=A0A2V3J2D2_9FLOR|nr:hypothetical protein BWQ96_01951 [Gracilariopsis chorda]|eukprot:PXF48262.1 hypothetical protein BWQ96_01951 [Gracilariopsis chorda]
MSFSAREELLGDRKPNSNSSTYGSVNEAAISAEERLEQQRQSLLAQNGSLEDLSTGVESVRRIAGIMHEEVDSQNVILDDITRGMDRASQRVVTADRGVEGSAQSPYNIRSFCLLLWPLVLLIILVIEAIVHFIF